MLVHTKEPRSGTVRVAQLLPLPVVRGARVKAEIKTEDMEGIVETVRSVKNEESEMSVKFEDLAITKFEKADKSPTTAASRSSIRQGYRNLDSTSGGAPSVERRQRAAAQPYGQRPQDRARTDGVRPPKPAPTDPSTWPDSTLDLRDRISAGNARKFYRLSKDELAGLRFIAKASRNKPYAARWNPMHLYKTCEVERLTWEKHGGPDGWKWELDRLRDMYAKTHPGKRFAAPGSSRRSRKVSYHVNQALEELSLEEDADGPCVEYLGDCTGCCDNGDDIRAIFAYFGQ